MTVSPAERGRRRRRRLAREALAIALIGLVVTVALSWTARRVDRNNEHRLLQVQTKQAANLISATILGITYPLQTVLDVAAVTDGDPTQFRHFMSGYTGPKGVFASASLWRVEGADQVLVASAGGPAVRSPESAEARTLLAHAVLSSTFVVASSATTGPSRISYALAKPAQSRYVVYAERAIPANRRVPVESNPAFADLDFATYLGPTVSASSLVTTDLPTSQLPLSGDTVRETIPFGDSVITLVAASRPHLGGAVAADLPWIVLAGGLLLTCAAAIIARQLVKRRSDAEGAALTISGLYGRLDHLYAEQRSIAVTLQQALLPSTNPELPGLESASRYVAGARGVDIGGDWYSLIRVDAGHFAFVVGDVSGRGVDAAAVMARIRFTLRAYLLEGHPPEVALAMTSRQLDINVDGHMATVLVGVGDLQTRQVRIANAGHLNPLLIWGDDRKFVTTVVGLPLGVVPTSYRATTVDMPAGSMLLAFTDGLVERRTEAMSVGFARLVEATAVSGRPLEDLVTSVLSSMTADGPDDDTAILAFRWTDGDGSP